MTIATCPSCSNTGAVGERYCDCPAAAALRARLDADPRLTEVRARIDRLLDGRAEPAGTPPSYGWLRPIAFPADAPADVQERIRAYNALVGQPPEYRCARCKASMHAAQGSFPAHEGSICYACHTRPPEPRYLTLRQPDSPEVN